MNQVEEHLSTAGFAGPGSAREEAPGPLLASNDTQELRGRWDQIQTGFVDEPRAAVKQANEIAPSFRVC
jgi:hypothetical protein